MSLNDIMQLDICSYYKRPQNKDVWGDRERFTLRYIATLNIPVAVKLDIALSTGVLRQPVLDELWCHIVDEAVMAFEQRHPHDIRPRRANTIHRAYLRGEATEEEWRSAKIEAMNAAFEALYDGSHGGFEAALAACADNAQTAAMDTIDITVSLYGKIPSPILSSIRDDVAHRYLRWAIAADQ